MAEEQLKPRPQHSQWAFRSREEFQEKHMQTTTEISNEINDFLINNPDKVVTDLFINDKLNPAFEQISNELKEKLKNVYPEYKPTNNNLKSFSFRFYQPRVKTLLKEKYENAPIVAKDKQGNKIITSPKNLRNILATEIKERPVDKNRLLSFVGSMFGLDKSIDNAIVLEKEDDALINKLVSQWQELGVPAYYDEDLDEPVVKLIDPSTNAEHIIPINPTSWDMYKKDIGQIALSIAGAFAGMKVAPRFATFGAKAGTSVFGATTTTMSVKNLAILDKLANLALTSGVVKASSAAGASAGAALDIARDRLIQESKLRNEFSIKATMAKLQDAAITDIIGSFIFDSAFAGVNGIKFIGKFLGNFVTDKFKLKRKWLAAKQTKVILKDLPEVQEKITKLDNILSSEDPNKINKAAELIREKAIKQNVQEKRLNLNYIEQAKILEQLFFDPKKSLIRTQTLLAQTPIGFNLAKNTKIFNPDAFRKSQLERNKAMREIIFSQSKQHRKTFEQLTEEERLLTKSEQVKDSIVGHNMIAEFTNVLKELPISAKNLHDELAYSHKYLLDELPDGQFPALSELKYFNVGEILLRQENIPGQALKVQKKGKKYTVTPEIKTTKYGLEALLYGQSGSANVQKSDIINYIINSRGYINQSFELSKKQINKAKQVLGIGPKKDLRQVIEKSPDIEFSAPTYSPINITKDTFMSVSDIPGLRSMINKIDVGDNVQLQKLQKQIVSKLDDIYESKLERLYKIANTATQESITETKISPIKAEKQNIKKEKYIVKLEKDVKQYNKIIRDNEEKVNTLYEEIIELENKENKEIIDYANLDRKKDEYNKLEPELKTAIKNKEAIIKKYRVQEEKELKQFQENMEIKQKKFSKEKEVLKDYFNRVQDLLNEKAIDFSISPTAKLKAIKELQERSMKNLNSEFIKSLINKSSRLTSDQFRKEMFNYIKSIDSEAMKQLVDLMPLSVAKKAEYFIVEHLADKFTYMVGDFPNEQYLHFIKLSNELEKLNFKTSHARNIKDVAAIFSEVFAVDKPINTFFQDGHLRATLLTMQPDKIIKYPAYRRLFNFLYDSMPTQANRIKIQKDRLSEVLASFLNDPSSLTSIKNIVNTFPVEQQPIIKNLTAEINTTIKEHYNKLVKEFDKSEQMLQDVNLNSLYDKTDLLTNEGIIDRDTLLKFATINGDVHASEKSIEELLENPDLIKMLISLGGRVVIHGGHKYTIATKKDFF